MIKIKKGLDLPIGGAPDMRVEDGPPVSRVALVGSDYQEMKPTLMVAEGDRVALGQPVFNDKKNPDVVYCAPAAGKVIAINRGERRVFLSLVIEVSGDDEKTFPVTPANQLEQLTVDEIQKRLITAGLWPAFRTRPYSKVPVPGTQPAALFVTAIDTNPLAADPQIAISEKAAEFEAGLKIVRHLTSGKTLSVQSPERTDPRAAGPHRQ